MTGVQTCALPIYGEQTRWNRNDFIGVLKDEYLPDWAKEALKQYQRPENEETQEMKMGGM